MESEGPQQHVSDWNQPYNSFGAHKSNNGCASEPLQTQLPFFCKYVTKIYVTYQILLTSLEILKCSKEDLQYFTREASKKVFEIKVFVGLVVPLTKQVATFSV